MDVLTESPAFPMSRSDNRDGDWSNVTFGNATDDNLDVRYWSFTLTVVLSIFLSLIIVFATFGNILVISVIIRHKGMRTRTNMFLFSLAVADFMVGSIVVPIALTTVIKGHWIFTETVCIITGFINCLCLVTSIHNLMYISIHKFVSITKPFSRFLTKKKILAMIAASWTWATIMGVITVVGLQTVSYKPGTTQCGPSYPSDLKTYLHHGIIQITCLYIPFGVMVFAYIRMFREIRKHTKRLRENSTLEMGTIVTQQKKVTLTLFIVLACFFMCWLPYHLYAMYSTLVKDKSGMPPFANALAYGFGYLNSACNPVIYALRSPSFRNGYLEILCRKQAIILSEDSIHPSQYSTLKRRISNLVSSLHRLDIRSQSMSAIGSGVGSQSSFGSLTHVINHSTTSPVRDRKRSSNGLHMLKHVPRSGKGSSVIKTDGSIVIMKDGKIVCVRNYSGSASVPTIRHSISDAPLVNNSTGVHNNSVYSNHTDHKSSTAPSEALPRDNNTKNDVTLFGNHGENVHTPDSFQCTGGDWVGELFPLLGADLDTKCECGHNEGNANNISDSSIMVRGGQYRNSAAYDWKILDKESLVNIDSALSDKLSVKAGQVPLDRDLLLRDGSKTESNRTGNTEVLLVDLNYTPARVTRSYLWLPSVEHLDTPDLEYFLPRCSSDGAVHKSKIRKVDDLFEQCNGLVTPLPTSQIVRKQNRYMLLRSEKGSETTYM